MKLNRKDFLERNHIANGDYIPLQHTPLVATDIADHKRQLERVYEGMLREASVIDDCCRRFEIMFRRNRFLRNR